MKKSEKLEPLRLGDNVEMASPLVLAPLAGHTDRAFRGLVRDLGGCGLVVTEMVSSEGLARGSEFSRELAATAATTSRRGSPAQCVADAATRTLQAKHAVSTENNWNQLFSRVTIALLNLSWEDGKGGDGRNRKP